MAAMRPAFPRTNRRMSWVTLPRATPTQQSPEYTANCTMAVTEAKKYVYCFIGTSSMMLATRCASAEPTKTSIKARSPGTAAGFNSADPELGR